MFWQNVVVAVIMGWGIYIWNLNSLSLTGSEISAFILTIFCARVRVAAFFRSTDRYWRKQYISTFLACGLELRRKIRIINLKCQLSRLNSFRDHSDHTDRRSDRQSANFLLSSFRFDKMTANFTKPTKMTFFILNHKQTSNNWCNIQRVD